MLQTGDIIGGMYQIIREIGKGGTGVIYLGYHLRLQKQIVIKKIKEDFTGRVNVRAEADILKKLHHTYLPQVYDFLAVGTGIYTVMDYIPGHDLQYYLDNGYSFPEKTVIRWMKQLCEVLCYLHTQKPKILHSDIKPGNIMITDQGNVCLIDFNISLDGETSKELQGISRYYAAPEQYRCALDKLYGGKGNIRLDERMDIYSLGAVFYRVMTGRYPNPESGAPYPVTELDIPYNEGLKNIVRKSMELSPGKRFQTAKEMGDALDNVAKMDPQYRMLTNLQYLSGFIWGLLVLTGVLLIYAGAGIYQKESWQEAYRSFYEATEEGDETRIITEGTDMLNDFILQGYMDDNPEEKAEVLHAMGDSYFRQEQYDSAAQYYEEALQEDGGESLYLRDYMIALARDGQYVDAAMLSAEYPEAGLQEAETVFVEAEAAYSGEDWEEALAGTAEALQLSTDTKLNARIYELQADIYTAMDADADAARAAAEAAELDQSTNLLRKAGQIAFNAGNAESRDGQKSAYYESALSYYEILCGRSSSSYEDCLNRALVLRALGRYQESNDRLNEMKEQYPDDYAILMWMCYNYLDEAAVEQNYAEIQGDLSFCYSSCRYLYDRQNGEDQEMESLIEIMNELE